MKFIKNPILRHAILRFLAYEPRQQMIIVKGFIRGILMRNKFDVWDFPIVEKGVQIIKRKGARFEAGKFVIFGENCRIEIGTDYKKCPVLKIGTKSSIGARTQIHVGDDILIGNNTLISWDCDLSSDNYHAIIYEKGKPPDHRSSKILIGDNTIIYRRTIINSGVTIGNNSAVASGSVVTKDIPSNTLATGSPALPKQNIKRIMI